MYIATKWVYFSVDDIMYLQTDGIAMASGIG